jgi:predicted MFS family arabinose efflux permease
MAAGMGLSVLGFQQAYSWGWDSPATWLCVVGGLAILAVFVRYEKGVRHPLIDLRVFRDRGFTVDAAVLFFAMLAFVPLFFFASVYAQVSLSASPNQAALFLLYVFAGFAIASQWGGRILDQRGARPALKAGAVVGCVGFALWAGKLTDLSMHDQWPYAALAGAGIGFILAPASTDAVNRAIGPSYGEVTGVTQTVRNYAASVGMAVFGTMLTHATRANVTDTLQARGLSAEQARDTAHRVSSSITGSGDANPPSGTGATADQMHDIVSAVRLDFAEANQWVFYGMAVALGIAFLCALRHPGGTEAAAGASSVEAPHRQAATKTD